MRTVSPGFGGVIIGAAVICSLAYAMGDGNALADFVIGLISRAADATVAAFHDAVWSVGAML